MNCTVETTDPAVITICLLTHTYGAMPVNRKKNPLIFLHKHFILHITVGPEYGQQSNLALWWSVICLISGWILAINYDLPDQTENHSALRRWSHRFYLKLCYCMTSVAFSTALQNTSNCSSIHQSISREYTYSTTNSNSLKKTQLQLWSIIK